MSGGNRGIYARNDGTGTLTISANGNVTSAGGDGIDALNSGTGTNITVTTGVGTTVSGGNNGILARNYGTGALTIIANSNVTGTSGYGIFAFNLAGTDLSVTTGAALDGERQSSTALMRATKVPAR